MSFLEALPAFLAAHEAAAYFTLFALSFAETLIGIGFFIYGELIFLPAAALAGADVLDIWLVSAALILGGAVGDSTSFWLGAKYGTRFLEGRGTWVRVAYEKGSAYFKKYGPKAVFFARFLGPLSWVTPFLAGTYRIPYRQFLFNNIPGVVLGIGQFLIIGFFFGASYKTLLPELRVYGNVVIVLTIVAVIAYNLYKYLRDKKANNS